MSALIELPTVKTLVNEPAQRAFVDTLSGADLSVWVDENGSPIGFQFGYNLYDDGEILIWNPEDGLTLNKLDFGTSNLTTSIKPSPIIADQIIIDCKNLTSVLNSFNLISKNVEPSFQEFVVQKIQQYLNMLEN